MAGFTTFLQKAIAQSTGDVEYTDCFSAEGLEPPNECPDMTQNNPMMPPQ